MPINEVFEKLLFQMQRFVALSNSPFIYLNLLEFPVLWMISSHEGIQRSQAKKTMT